MSKAVKRWVAWGVHANGDKIKLGTLELTYNGMDDMLTGIAKAYSSGSGWLQIKTSVFNTMAFAGVAFEPEESADEQNGTET